MNQLKQIAEFRSVLNNYKLSASAEQVLADTQLVLLVGPSGGGGRNTIIRELLQTGRYHYIVSDTTRHIRIKDGVPIEQDGREYWFRSEAEILDDLRQGEFLEAAVIHEQQVSGISIREVAKARTNHLVAITDVETAGAATIHNLKPDTTIVFVVPPDFTTWMQRLRSRSDLPESEIRRRMEGACREFRAVLAHDYYTIVVNDKLDEAVAEIHHIVTTGDRSTAKEQIAHRLVEQLLQDAQAYLAQPVA